MPADCDYIDSAAATAPFPSALWPMVDQKLVREFTRHGDMLDAKTYCQATA